MATTFAGINYFPLSTQFFERREIEILEATYGCRGTHVIFKLMAKIYNNGYFIKWGKDEALIFASKLGSEITPELLNGIIELLVDKEFFDQESFRKHGIITSREIQKTWIEATARRKRDLAECQYLLIDKEELTDEEKPKKESKKCKQKTSSNSENADNFRQSKVDKEEKEDKELPPSTPPEGNSKEERRSEPVREIEVPLYALDINTHNYEGLRQTLRHLRVTDINEVNAIMHFSNFGRKCTPIWSILSKTVWSKIKEPGKYLISMLRKTGSCFP